MSAPLPPGEVISVNSDVEPLEGNSARGESGGELRGVDNWDWLGEVRALTPSLLLSVDSLLVFSSAEVVMTILLVLASEFRRSVLAKY